MICQTCPLLLVQLDRTGAVLLMPRLVWQDRQLCAPPVVVLPAVVLRRGAAGRRKITQQIEKSTENKYLFLGVTGLFCLSTTLLYCFEFELE